MRHTCFILGFLLYCTYSIAQSYFFKNLSKIDGLSNNYVSDIVQDRQGFIWIATEAGLNRFDGQKFTVFNTLNSNLHNNAINTLLYDEAENQLWIGTRANLSILNCSTLEFENYKEFDSIPLINIVHLSHGTEGRIWITNRERGVICYNKKDKQATLYSNLSIEGLPSSNICSYEDGNSNLYIGHNQYGLSVVNLSTCTIENFYHDPQNPKSLPGNKVQTIKYDSKGNIWIGTNRGLALFNPRKGEFITFRHKQGDPSSLIGNNICGIKEINNGSLWILADIEGISILDLYDLNYAHPESVKFSNLTPADDLYSITPGNIRSLLQDSFGNIWIGNSRNGLDFIAHTPPAFHTLPYTCFQGKEFRNKSVWGIYVDSKQQIWVGGEDEIALFQNNQLKQTFDIKTYKGNHPAPIYSIKEDVHGNILFGTKEAGLIRYNAQTQKLEYIDSSPDNLEITTFFEDRNGEIWFGSQYGVYTYANGKVEQQSIINNQLNTRSVYGIYRDKQDKLWVGVFGGGVFIFDSKDKLITQLHLGNGFISDAISCLGGDSQGGLWIASRNAGIAYIPDTNSPEKFVHYGIAQGMNDLYVRAIQEDQSGNLWFSTNNGISVLNRERQTVFNYDYHDGIPIGIFADGSASTAPDGTIYFGSLNGVCYFNPESVTREQKIAPIQIVECEVFNTRVANSEEDFIVPFMKGNIDLKYYQNSFRISFSVPDYTQNQQVEYSYMIEGLQDIWLNTAGESQVTFRNIPPGKYTFKVKARLKNQGWDESHIASTKIQIHPPVWFAWYAKALYILMACLVVYTIVRTYKHRLMLKGTLEVERRNNQNERELNQERMRFYTNIAHELRTPLTLILGPLEDLTKDKKFPSPYMSKVGNIYASAVQLLNLINQLLEFRKTETQNRKLTVAKGNISNLITETGLRYMELNQNPELEFRIHMETERVNLYFDTEIVTMILNNLLSNAVKYTPKGEISLTLSTVYEGEAEYTAIKVSDTGYGIAPEALPHVFDRYYQAKSKYQASGTGIGLSIVKSLADLHEGLVRVESELGQGTTFTFCLPTQNTYTTLLQEQEEEIHSLISQDVREQEEDTVSDSLLILVIEDNRQIREYITSSLAEEYTVITAENGKEGLQQAQEKIPNIIISDIMMPEMDGIRFCRLVKEDIRTSHIPVILLTAKDSIYDKEKGYESGADSYITKPFSVSLLQRRIQNLLDNRRRLAKQMMSGSQEINMSDRTLINSLDEQFLSKITILIQENIDKVQLDVPFLGEKTNLSYSTFYRKIKALTGLSPNEFIRKVRLKKSTELLLAGPYNISEVTYMTGFNDIPYFRRCFKEEFGMTPSEYIKKFSH